MLSDIGMTLRSACGMNLHAIHKRIIMMVILSLLCLQTEELEEQETVGIGRRL